MKLDSAWYRLLKVVFILVFLISQLIGFAIVQGDINSEEIVVVHCENGKEYKENYSYLVDDQFQNGSLIDSKAKQECQEDGLTKRQKEFKKIQNQILEMKALDQPDYLIVDEMIKISPDNSFKQIIEDAKLTETPSKIISDFLEINPFDSSSIKTNYSASYELKSGIFRRGFNYFIAFSIILFIFLLIRGAFLYIVTGKFVLPK